MILVEGGERCRMRFAGQAGPAAPWFSCVTAGSISGEDGFGKLVGVELP